MFNNVNKKHVLQQKIKYKKNIRRYYINKFLLTFNT